MAVIESPTRPSAFMQVDQTNAAARMSVRPSEYIDLDGKTYGHFQHAGIVVNGAVSISPIAAGTTVSSFRWTDPTSLMVIVGLYAYWVPLAKFVPEQELGLDAIIARQWTSIDSGPGAEAMTNESSKAKFSMSSTLNTQWQVSGANNTTGITPGTRTVDTNPFVVGSGLANIINSAAGTQYTNPGISFGFKWTANYARGEYPIVLAANEGIVVRNLTSIAAGLNLTFVMDLTWSEVPSF